MTIIQIEVPNGYNCTGCPCSLILPPELAKAEKKFWAYGCSLLHCQCKSGGEYDNYAIKPKNCPSLIPQLVIDPSKKLIAKKGSSKGGFARANKLSPERRKEIAKNAAASRWAKGLGR